MKRYEALELARERSESPPEVMLGLLLLGTSFVTGFVIGILIA